MGKNKCPKCKINIKDEIYTSIRERHISVLLAEKRKKEIEGTYEELKDGEDCDLCGAALKEIFLDKIEPLKI